MKKSISNKIIIISMIIIAFSIFKNGSVKASTKEMANSESSNYKVESIEMSEVTKLADAEDMKLSDSDKQTIYNTDYTVKRIGGQILSYVTYICYAVALVIVTVKGVQFMKASPEGKAQIKEQMIAVVVGGIILFAAGTFIKIIGSMVLNNIF